MTLTQLPTKFKHSLAVEDAAILVLEAMEGKVDLQQCLRRYMQSACRVYDEMSRVVQQSQFTHLHRTGRSCVRLLL